MSCFCWLCSCPLRRTTGCCWLYCGTEAAWFPILRVRTWPPKLALSSTLYVCGCPAAPRRVEMELIRTPPSAPAGPCWTTNNLLKPLWLCCCSADTRNGKISKPSENKMPNLNQNMSAPNTKGKKEEKKLFRGEGSTLLSAAWKTPFTS